LEAKGKNVTIIGLDGASQEWHNRLAGHLAGAH
jgi:SulP family sulfate permease